MMIRFKARLRYSWLLLVVGLLSAQQLWAQCTNCTTTTVGGDVVHTFTAGSGTFTPPYGLTTVRYLVVGGGGGGGGITSTGAADAGVGGAGGGGAGGVQAGNLAVTPMQNYSVTVGGGGAGGVGGSSSGGSGGASVFATINAAGGGGGASVGFAAVSGGSGGGGRLGASGASGIAGQGNGGGAGAGTTTATGAAGGGGGAGVGGGNGSANTGGTGGTGVSNNITGAAITYAGGGRGGGFFGGSPAGAGGAGGAGGGGSSPNARGAGGNGAANTGGGGGGAGGGAGAGAAFSGGAGGSGIVMIRYTPPPANYYTRVASGNWSANATWSNAGCNGTAASSTPHLGADVVICNGHAITLNTNGEAGSLLIQTGNADTSLTHAGTNALTVGAGGVTVDLGSSAATQIKSWNINAGSAVVNGPVTINGGTNPNRLARIQLTTGTLNINGNLTFGVNPDRAILEATGAANIFLSGSINIPNGGGTLIPGTASTFTYNGTGTQTVLLGVSDINYYNLTLAGSGTKNQTTWSTPTIPGATTVSAGVTFNNSASVVYGGNFVNNGSTNASATHDYQGNFVNSGVYTNTAGGGQNYRSNFTNSGSFTSGTGLHTFNGSVTQTLTGVTTFANLAFDNSAGFVLNSDIEVSTQLNLTNGVVTTGSNILRVAQTGWSGVNRSNGWVAGNLGLWMPTGSQSRTFDIGAADAYRPLVFNAPNVTTAGFVVASISQTSGDHPELTSSDLDPALSVNRWWTLNSEGAVATNMQAVFNYLAGDRDGGADPQNFEIRRFSGGTWSDVTVGARTATSTQGTAIAGFGQFAIAELGDDTTPPACAAGEALSGGLIGQYFNNMTLSGGATATQVDGPIDFDWGGGAPGVPGIGADFFSVRWEGVVRTGAAGNYRFQVVADDGVRLWVNNQLLIDQWVDQPATTYTSAPVSLAAGEAYSIRLEYYENAGNAVIRLRWETPGGGSFVPIPPGPMPTPGAGLYHCASVSNEVCPGGGVPTGGIEGDYFNNMTLSGSPTGHRVDGPIDFDWATGAPGVAGIGVDNFSVRWEGRLRAPETGNYQFQTVSDDGVRLWVNNVLVISNWTDHSATTDTSGNVALVAGETYSIRLEYYENGGSAVIRLRWRLPSSGSYVPIPPGPTPTLGGGLYHCPDAPIVTSYSLTHSPLGITCEAETVTITALDSTNNPVAPPPGTLVELATAPPTGVWVGGNTYVFSGTETSFVRALQQTTAAVLDLTASDGSAVGASSIEFVDAALRFDGLPALPDSMAAGADYGGATLRAVRTNTETGACEARVAGPHSVNLAYECRNPANCVAGQSLSVNGVAAASNSNENVVAFNPVNLVFDANGVAPLTLNYTDVGLLRLHAQLPLPADGDDPAVTLPGSSAEFVVRPHTMALTLVQNSDGNNNAGTTSSGIGFTAAGQAFSVVVQAQNASGNPTPNYFIDTAPIALRLGDLLYPSPGSTGTLVNTTNFTALGGGAFENAGVSWSEVGTVELNAHVAGGSYLGASAGDAQVNSPNTTVGRFYPNDFELTVDGEVEPACSSFSYFDQNAVSVTYTLTARNLQAAPVTNYNTSLGYNTATVSYVAEDDNNGTDLGARLTVDTGDWVDGALITNDVAANFSRAASAVPDGPFHNLQLGLRVDDSLDSRELIGLDMAADASGNCIDSDTCNARALGNPHSFRFGRLRLDSAYGPEVVALPVPFLTEFWDGNRFVPSAGDSCTRILFSQISYNGQSLADPANCTVPIGSGSEGVYAYSDCNSGGEVEFVGGRAGLMFTPPGAVGQFTMDVNLIDRPWLTFDWNQNGSFNTALPTATIGFGSYRGHDRVIYWREILE